MIDSPTSETPGSLPMEAEHPVYCQHNLWYFRTAAGDEVGPFRYRSEAETGLGRFLDEQQRQR